MGRRGKQTDLIYLWKLIVLVYGIAFSLITQGSHIQTSL